MPFTGQCSRRDYRQGLGSVAKNAAIRRNHRWTVDTKYFTAEVEIRVHDTPFALRVFASYAVPCWGGARACG
jgi:hypothetical protein